MNCIHLPQKMTLQVTYNNIIVDIIKKAKNEGKEKVILYGNSYIKFLIVYACKDVGMEFVNVSLDTVIDLSSLCFIGEISNLSEENKLIPEECVSLVNIVNDK